MKKLELRNLLLVAALLLATNAGCSLFDDDEDDDGDPTPPSVVVGNGGNFSDQNGYLTLYDSETDTTTDLDNLGAYVNSFVIDDGMAYVALNTFGLGRVDVVDLASGSVIRQFELPAPRSIALTSDNSLVVTNLSEFGSEGPEPGVVSIVNSTTGDPAAEDGAAGLYPEGVVIHDGLAYVANTGSLGAGSTISVIDPATGATVRTLDVGCDGPNEVFVDEDDELVVVCEGMVVYNEDFTEIIEQTNGQVLFVDASSGAVGDRIELPTQAISASQTQSAYYASESEELYVLSGDGDQVYRVDTNANMLAATIDIPSQSDLTGLAAVAYDATSERLYLARMAVGAGGFPDFTSRGAVIVVNRAGTLVDRFAVGPAPSHIEIADL